LIDFTEQSRTWPNELKISRNQTSLTAIREDFVLYLIWTERMTDSSCLVEVEEKNFGNPQFILNGRPEFISYTFNVVMLTTQNFISLAYIHTTH